MADTFNIMHYEGVHPNRYAALARQAFDAAMANEGKLPEDVFSVVGFSGRKIRLFFNNLVSAINDARYMEIGVYCGASFISALFQNKIKAVGIDNWSWEGSKRALFYQKLADLCSDGNTISLLDMDFHEVNFAGFSNYNVLFYDGSHEEKDQYDGVMLPQPALADEYVLIVDDWNWEHVRRATFRALTDVGATIDMSIELRTTMDNALAWWAGSKSDWHNGLFIAAVRKN
jgi:hypothetical protein